MNKTGKPYDAHQYGTNYVNFPSAVKETTGVFSILWILSPPRPSEFVMTLTCIHLFIIYFIYSVNLCNRVPSVTNLYIFKLNTDTVQTWLKSEFQLLE